MLHKLQQFYFCRIRAFRPVSGIILQRGNALFLVKKPRKDHAWQLPQGGKDLHETFLEAAKRELCEECGDIIVRFSPCPKGTYWYNFPPEFARHTFYKGAFVVFFHAVYISGDIMLQESELCDGTWVAVSDLESYTSKTYARKILSFLK